MIMEMNNIVVRLKNNRVFKGKTNDFFSEKPSFHLKKLDGEIIGIHLEQLKAVFFVKDIHGDETRMDSYNDNFHGVGEKLKCTFYDGESITGYSLDYSPTRHGFYMIPASSKGNNKHIFVVNSAIKNVEFL